MTSRLLALDLVLILLVAGLWVAAASTTTAAPRPGLGRWLPLGLIAAALLTTAGRVTVVGALATSGWAFVGEKVLVTLPLVVVPAVAAAALAVPRLLVGRPLGRAARAALFGAAAGGVAGVAGAFVTGYPVTPLTAVALAVPVGLATLAAWVPASAWRSRQATGAVAAGAAVVLLAAGTAWWVSRVPDRVDAAGHAAADHGGGATVVRRGGVSVADLRGPEPSAADRVRRFTLTAQRATVTLPGGRPLAAWTFDRQLPGPQLTVTQGDLVEVLLRNRDIPDGVTIHWHGYPVPAGEDGVAGVTQDAVKPGAAFRYRFRATVAGTFWYHGHQASGEAVRRGLYGALVVLPAVLRPAAGVDLAVPVHTLDGVTLVGAVDGVDRRRVRPGTPVRLRLIDTDDGAHVFAVRGTAFRLAAVDGREITAPGLLDDERLPLAAGGRYDLTFTMPVGPVRVSVDGREDRGLQLNGDPARRLGGPTAAGPLLDLTRYGTATTPLPTRFDRRFTLVLDRQLRFHEGTLRYAYTVNGRVYPDIPTELVRRGELVRITVVNRGTEPHPMHPHGHSVRVLGRNGHPATGAALELDTFEVGPGEVWEVALRADNPGIWMSHCHNLRHAARGMTLHLAYEGVHTPFATGSATGNHPE